MNIFWDIKDVNNYEELYNSGIIENNHFHRTYDLVKNLSYNTQYLEFLDNALNQRIHSSLVTEFTKTFVIIGMSIVESILYYFIKSEDLQKTIDYKEITTLESNWKKSEGRELKTQTKILERLSEPMEIEMTLDSMLKKAERKKMFGDDHTIYAELKRLRQLRNKVHIHAIEKDLDHDWHNFDFEELVMMKKSLDKILYSERFEVDKMRKDELLDFLVVEE